jgi:hypothetical protein
MTMEYLPVRQPHRRLGHEDFAARSGLHPDLLRRYVALGLVRATRDADGRLWFAPGELAAVARVERLHRGLPLNYAAVGLVIELLDRIQLLESALRRRSDPGRPARPDLAYTDVTRSP